MLVGGGGSIWVGMVRRKRTGRKGKRERLGSSERWDRGRGMVVARLGISLSPMQLDSMRKVRWSCFGNGVQT